MGSAQGLAMVAGEQREAQHKHRNIEMSMPGRLERLSLSGDGVSRLTATPRHEKSPCQKGNEKCSTS